ncbi:MAG TPA: hypothetical protein VF756_02850 [Thermoanaerobaculia bacterium]
MEIVSYIHPDSSHFVTERLTGIADVRFGGRVYGANVMAQASPETQPYTLTVRGVEDLQAVCQALQEIGCRAWVPQTTEQGIESVPLEEFMNHQASRIEWR